MAIQLQIQDSPDSSLWVLGGTDIMDAMMSKLTYNVDIPVLSSFPLGLGYFSSTTGEDIIGDTGHQQIFLRRNDQFRLIAGMRGVSGFRDGPGDQAIFGLGGLQDISYDRARDSAGAWYITDAKNSRIRKLTEQGNGTWNVSTFATGISSNALVSDSAGNLWASSGNTLSKFVIATGVRTNYTLPANNILTIRVLVDGSGLVLLTRNNSWDVVYKFNPADATTTRICGINDSEVTAFCAAVGITEQQYFQNNHDGPVSGATTVDKASLHSPGMGYINDDASEIWFGGGDERQVRRFRASTGRIDSLFPDGTWQETTIRVAAPHSDPNKPFFVVQPSGRNEHGYPNVSGVYFIPNGGLTSSRKIVPVEIGDPGLVNNASFISQSIPSPMVAGVQYSVTVTMRNTGQSTWTPGTNYRLGSQNPQDNLTWNLPQNSGCRVNMAAGSSIAPNNNYSFVFQVRAPATPGFYNMQFKMLREGVEWFGAFSTNVQVQVTAAPTQTIIPCTVSIKL